MDRGGQRPVILVGVGGSGASHAALAWAAREARRRQARLRVVQAWQPHPARALYAGTGNLAAPSTQATAAERLDLEVGSVLASTPGVSATDIDLVVELVNGPAERVLAEASASADLLVLGSGVQSPVAQPDPLIVDRPVGPVIRACMSHARCPVVIINPMMATGRGPDPAGSVAQAPACARS
ncbi:MAG TPA: universal stress protein [Streptosporangiaceae bacterium]